MQKVNYHSTSSSLTMQSRLITPLVLVPFTPYMPQKSDELKAMHFRARREEDVKDNVSQTERKLGKDFYSLWSFHL